MKGLTPPNIPARPRIRRQSRHWDCYRTTFTPDGTFPYPDEVRQCEHGKVQIAYAAPARSGMLGAAGWRDLSPFWNRTDYREACKLLGIDPKGKRK